MQNRVQRFVRRILQNSQLNREKFVMNKKLYKTIQAMHKPYYQMIITRTIRTHAPQEPRPPKDCSFVMYMLGVGTGFIIAKA